MRSIGGGRLVMVAGDSAGAGKSTVASQLASRFGAYGPVLEVLEDHVWGARELGSAPVDRSTAAPLFHELLHADSARVVGPAAVVAVFEQLQREALRRSAVWVQDWHWGDLMIMLGWDHALRQRALRDLRELSSPLSPLVVRLEIEPVVALQRAIRERGATWFNRYAGRPLDAPVTSAAVREVAAARARASAARATENDWPEVLVDASAAREDVVENAWFASTR